MQHFTGCPSHVCLKNSHVESKKKNQTHRHILLEEIGMQFMLLNPNDLSIARNLHSSEAPFRNIVSYTSCTQNRKNGESNLTCMKNTTTDLTYEEATHKAKHGL